MKKAPWIAAAFLLALAFASTPAYANSIGTLTLSNCGTAGTQCPAATYDLNIGTTSATLTITINPSAVLTTGSHGNNQITAVALNFTSPQSNIANFSSTVATIFQGSAGPNWAGSLGTLNNSGCSSTSQAGFVCADPGAGSPVTVVAGGSYSWTWTYSLVDPTKIFAVDQVTIKTNYGLHNGLIVSQTGASPTNPVPEPATLGMVGTGLLAAAGLLRRRYNL